MKDAPLADEIRVVYLSPLRALSNDMHRNLEVPLEEIYELAAERGLEMPPIRVGLRTGDTPSHKRAALVKRPPHILVTTPESLYLMLTGPKSRQKFKHVQTVIVDEIHALVRDKRGSHMALSLERLEAVCGRKLQRIGLSATQRPLDRIAQFLTGVGDGTPPQPVEETAAPPSAPTLFDDEPEPDSAFRPFEVASGCEIVDVGHSRELDLQIELPDEELGAACTHEQWAEIYEKIVALIELHRSTLIFVNTRRMAERVSHQLTELLGEDAVSSHHGSLAADMRQKTEQRLKNGQLKAVVATASLELGLDIGFIDLVIQNRLAPVNCDVFAADRPLRSLAGARPQRAPVRADARRIDGVARAAARRSLGKPRRRPHPGNAARRVGAADRRPRSPATNGRPTNCSTCFVAPGPIGT